MIWVIIRKEFLLNLVNFRFIAGFILCFMLSVLSAWILTQDYAERMAEYSGAVQEHRENLENVKIYSDLALRGGLTVDKRPEPLGLLSEGVEKYLNNSVTISLGEVPTVSSSAGQGNPLLAGLASLDVALIVRVIFSLLALLFVYDSISRERERGTLSLLMSNPVPRHQVLLGKYLGILLSLFVPILCGMLAAVLIILLSLDVELSSSDGMRLVLISLVSLLYVSVFCNIGIFVSSRCSRSTTSLMLLLFFWVTFILLVPKASAYIASYVKPASSLDVVNDRVGLLKREFDGEVAKINKRYPRGVKSWSSDEWGDDKVLVGEKKGVMFPYLERTKFREPLRIRYADKIHSVRQEYLRELERQSALANNLARISPSVNYENLISSLAKTDAGSHLRFIERTRNYRRELISYLQSKKAFSSFLFFTRMKEEEMPDGKGYDEWVRPKKFSSWDSVEPLELSDLPKFQFKGLSIAYSISHTMVDVVMLIVLNLLFFMFAYISFLRGGVKG